MLCGVPAQIGNLQALAQFLSNASKSVSGTLADLLSPARMIIFGTLLTTLNKPMFAATGAVYASFGTVITLYWVTAGARVPVLAPFGILGHHRCARLFWHPLARSSPCTGSPPVRARLFWHPQRVCMRAASIHQWCRAVMPHDTRLCASPCLMGATRASVVQRRGRSVHASLGWGS